MPPSSLRNFFQTKLKFPRIPVIRYYHSDKVEIPTGRWGLTEWVLGRQHYHIARLDLRNVPRNAREQALQLQLKPWSPFAQTGHLTYWQDGWAIVFCWDAAAVTEQITSLGLKPGRVKIIPETTLRPQAEQEIRLIHGLSGYEGQIWTQNQLTHNRHWPHPPTLPAWIQFQRDASTSIDRQLMELPTPQSLPWLPRPWRIQNQGLSALGEGWRDEKWLYILLALISLTLLSAAASQQYQLSVRNQQLEQQAESERIAAAPLAEARGRALQSLQTLETIARLDPYPSQLQVLAWIAENLLKKGDRIMEWDYQKDGSLKMTLQLLADTQVTLLVEKLHKTELFNDVRSLPANKPHRVTLEMKLKPVGAPREAADAA